MENKARILSTAILGQQLIDKAAASGVVLDAMPFINVIDSTAKYGLYDHIRQLLKKHVTAVFTSVNAVNAISRHEHFIQPEWEIYCIGHATKSAIEERFPLSEIKGTADDAAALADIIKQKGEESVIFFCGDKRMDTLHDALENAGIITIELVVYQTTETPTIIEKEYDGILFFSPSGVHSFFSMNIIGPGAVLFAIGNTTAYAIKERTDNKVIVSQLPSKEFLVEQAINYFQKRAIA